ncbi:MAG: Glyoxalase-like domain protein [Candidatus Izimaplasma bacterium HR2]|nr:MAG: Glyoxalase-like domain protein [Candidatus Izimaplasma bacterium HR2]
MAKITGIGGIFLKLDDDHKKLTKWYHEILDVTVSDYGLSFLEPNVLTHITFNRKSDAEPILNFTVDNLEEFMINLKKKNVKVISEIQEYSYGKFAQIEDILGKVVEFWEPYVENYLEMVSYETKKYKK